MSGGSVVVVRTGVANLASVVAGLRRVGLEVTVTDDPSRIAEAERLVLPGVGSFAAAMTELQRHDLVEPLARRIQSGRPTLAVCLGLQLLGASSEESPGCCGLQVFAERARRFDWRATRQSRDRKAAVRTDDATGDSRTSEEALLTEQWHTSDQSRDRQEAAIRHARAPARAATSELETRKPELRRVRVPQLGWNFVRPDPGCTFVQPGYAYFANSYRLLTCPPGWRAAWADHGGRFVAALERGAVLACQFHPELSGAWGEALLRRWAGRRSAPLPCGRGSDRPEPQPQGGPDRCLTVVALNEAERPLTRRIIPCLDCRDGRVVKGVQFTGLRDVGRPADCAAAYQAQGADEIVLLDVSATAERRENQVETVRAVRRVLSIPLTVGGGVRGVASARALLDAGADKVAINTAAVRDPDLINQLAAEFGRQCTVLAVDAARDEEGGWSVVICSGRERTALDAVSWCREGARRGAGEILLTSWDRDGTRHGYDLELLGAATAAVTVPVIGSGGAATPAHLLEALRAGADAVLAASIFHERAYTVAGVKDYLAKHAIEVRR